ncbi:MAG: aminotransferase class V-fold PLP-dependent enzyme [Planctomycetes bacterium]|nr:aminotransferase class V-fold PLP-dependent enzyme [Planctomycetota bacterium]
MAIYLDCNATNPIDPRVRNEITRVFDAVYGNAGSPHEFGEQAKQLVGLAREQITQVTGDRRHEIVFTSGATESNNLAILGAAAHGQKTGKMHLVSSMIEHKAVLEPLQVLRKQGFEVTLIRPQSCGRIDPDEMLHAVRDDTLLISVMQVNNETGVIQPVEAIANGLTQRDCLFHVDAAQGFAKLLEPLRNPRIDLISISGHKIHGPQGIGALIARRKQGQLPPIAPLIYGGGQEFGLRPGTLPVPLIAGLGLAAQLAAAELNQRREHCIMIRKSVLVWAQSVNGIIHGSHDFTMPHVVNLSIPGFTADELIEQFQGLIAVSDGAACTTICTTPSHVLSAMGIREPELSGAIRLSWSFMTDHDELHRYLQAAKQKLGR